ncbi:MULTISPECIES: MFS transporter [unclassified Pseudomonas]|uniref:MFS transporter n=1 Tax=unclassified Pseudomonas TaxID=196821 RepID=UPI0002A2900B|nr:MULTISPECIES: MFS transporter [unclassified Pseudomonas]MBB1610365.1 MFS transporter [Pseudomonas sp. UMC76]MBB1642087.1 MFS transporter [Pseudomonas sp. UME83]NTX93046.1 MFS transporter [Pseudomonas sp. UMA643]NTY22478.1 MFS transporter [Pseudomonas sp. UMC3103]NTY28513.1 MFS transporter [Pseudomonas sp. UMA603]
MTAQRPAGTAQALLLLFGSCLPVLGAVLIAPVLPRMQAHFAETPGAAVLVPVALTLPALVIAFLAPLAGLLADRIGRRPLLLASMLLYSLCGVLPLWLDSLGLIVASRAGIGLAEAGIMTCCTTLMGDYFDGQRRERLFALQMVATSLSAALFMGLGGALGESGWRTPFALYAVGLLCLPLMAALLWEPQVRHAGPLRADVEGFPWAALAPLYLLTLLAGVSLFIVPVQAGYLLQLLHVDAPQQVGMTMGANQLGVLAGALAFRLLATLPARRLLALGFATAGLGGALMALADSHALVVLAVLVNGLGVGLLLPTLITQVMLQVGFEQRGRATGGFTASIFAGEFLSPLLVLAITGGANPHLPQALLAVAIGQLILAPLCLVLLRHGRPAPMAQAL